ncbi:MAG TPA: HAMP domain-containing sensor histidine kinase [Planctomycetaceae bacterium]|nr:HAMP domain-containing sensor histidine kinase [Planctomycetaceae bacterium]
MPHFVRQKRTLHLPITLSVALLSLNVTLMICWIVILAKQFDWGALTIGTVAFSLMIIGLSIYMGLTIKEIRLNQRQSNFVDSVTHELKTPIASLKLYLETLQMRELEPAKRTHFYAVMGDELQRLDTLINQLLEVGRLDAIGHETEEEQISLDEVILNCARSAAASHKLEFEEVFQLRLTPIKVISRRIVLEMIFRNLLDNAIKYGGQTPHVKVELFLNDRGRIVARVIDHGRGIDPDDRSKIFKIFYRGGKELERRNKGTGLGLYIVRTLVSLLKGKIRVLSHKNPEVTGSVFEVELPESLLA